MDASAVRAGKAFVELGTKDAQYMKGMQRAQKRLEDFGNAMQHAGFEALKVGGMITAPFALAAHVFAESGSALYEMSKRTGVSVEALSQLRYAAEQNGIALEDLEVGIRKMQKAVGGAKDGSKEMIQALEGIGVNAENIINLAPEQQFETIAEALSRIKDPTERAASALKIFGRSGTALLPMIEDGVEGLRKWEQKAAATGQTMSGAAAESAHELERSYKTMTASVRALSEAVGGALAPSLQTTIDRATEFFGWVGKLAKALPRLTTAIYACGAAVTVFGVALAGIGFTATGIAKAIGFLRVAWAALKSVAYVAGAVLAYVGAELAIVAAAATAVGLAIKAISDNWLFLEEMWYSSLNLLTKGWNYLGYSIAKVGAYLAKATDWGMDLNAVLATLSDELRDSNRNADDLWAGRVNKARAGTSTGSKVAGASSADVDDALEGAAMKMHQMTVHGTFNPSAAFGLGTPTDVSKMRKANEDTAKNTGKMVSLLDQNLGMVKFA